MKVLVFGRNPTLLSMASTPLKAAGHQVSACSTDQEVQDLIAIGKFDVLVIGMAIEQSVRQTIRAKIAELGLNLKLVEPSSPAELHSLMTDLK